MSDVWHPLDPQGSRPQEPSGQDHGPDPEPIVRTVRVAFLLAGMSFVLTGGLDGLTREEATQAVEDRGGRVAGSVSKKTAFVVVGTDPGSKAARAAELGVPTLDEAGFRDLLERGPEENGPHE